MGDIQIVEELGSRVVPIFSDRRGKVGDFGDFLAQGLHVVTMQPGAVRGNHVHNQNEIICVLGGDGICEIIPQDQISGETANIVVEGDLKTYRIKAGIKHTLKNAGKSTFYLICFYEPD